MVFSTISGRIHVRKSVLLSAAITAVLLGAYLYFATLLVQTSQPQLAAASTVNHSVAKVQACAPMSDTQPSAVELDGQPSGLSVVNDPAHTYQIYGNTADQIRNQIRECAPGSDGSGGAEFTGETSYTMSWQYDLEMSDECHVTNVKVGVHIETSLPAWQATGSVDTGLNTRWQNFMGALTTHEAGHAALDKLYAGRILNDLNSLPAMNCDHKDNIVKAVVNSEISELNQANNNYDLSTNHGATQGAILPTH